MRGSLFRRFTLLSVLIAFVVVIPLVVFGLYAMQVASDHLARITVEDLKQDVLVDADKLKRAVDLAHADLPILSHLPTVQELIWARTVQNEAGIEFWLKGVERAFLSFSTNRRVYHQIRYIDEDGWEIVRVDYDGTHPPRLIPRARLRNKRDRDYFSETMKLGPGYVYASPLDLNREDGQIEVPYRPVIRYATPLFDDAGHRRGIVIINLLGGPLLEALAEAGRAARKEVYAVDQEGFYLLHPDPAKRWGGPRDRNTGQRLHQDFPALADRLVSPLAGTTVLKDHVLSWQPLALSSSPSGLSLVIIERVPTGIVLAAVTDLRLYLWMSLAGGGLVAVGGAVLVGNRLTRPIVALAQATHQVQQGDLNARVQVIGPHEIATLGEAFNAMAQGLAQARSQIERQLTELQARQRVTESILRVPDVIERLRIALQEILILLGPTFRGAIYVVEYGRLVLKVEEGFSPTFLALGRDVPLEACSWVGAPTEICIPWEGSDPITEALRQEGVMAWSSLPLVTEEKLVGILLLANSRATLMEEDVLRTLRAMVDQVAVALHHARLYAEGQEQLARLITLREIDQAIAEQLPLEEVISMVLERVHRHMRTDAVGLSLIDWEKKRTLLASLRLPGGTDIQAEAFALSESLLEALGVRLEPVIIYDLLSDPRVINNRGIIRQYGLKSYLGVPLIVQGQAIGILHVCSTTPHRFEADEIDFFATLAGQAAISVQNVRLYEAQCLATSRLTQKVEEMERMQARLIEAGRLQAMGQMAAGVAHDFNNALMGILGQAQLIRLFLEQGPVAAVLRGIEGYPDVLEYLGRQEQIVLDTAEIIRKIREATRQRDEAGFGPVALGEIVEQILAITRPRWKDQAEAAGVQLAVRTDLAETPPVLGRAAELREALMNLLFNAFDAMPQGGTLTIAARHVSGEWVDLSVTDTGVGMSQVVQAHLFEPFFTTKGTRGSGLGLSMVHGIVSRHQGEITVQSAEGQGTTVTLRLPVAGVETTEVVPSPDATLSLPSPLKLLVIDDDPRLAETLSELLRILGHEATVATSGKEGLALLATERFDIVMTDLGMPEMSGWEVAQAVKARWTQLPVILVSGWGDALEPDRLAETGVDLILAKPYTVAQLKYALAQGVALTRQDFPPPPDSHLS